VTAADSLSYGIAFAVAAAVTFVTTPLVRRMAIRVGAVVGPEERRVHTVPTPTLGGAAMFIAFLVAMVVASRLSGFANVFRGSSEPLAVALGAAVIFAVGLLDDVREVSAPAKVAGMVLAGGVLSLLGVTMFYFRIPFSDRDFVSLSPDLAPLVGILWVAGMANAINLIDGLDGLAAGIVAIAAGAFFLYTTRLSNGILPQDSIGPLVAVVTCGVCVGFLPHNFHPAKIFMGDGGALLLGLLMASSTMVVGGRVDDQFSGQTYFFFAPLVIPLVILGLPILDTVFAVVRRATHHAKLTQADKEHLHHRLMRMGHGQRRSVLILWAWTAVLSGIVLYPTYTSKGNAVVPTAVAIMGVGLYTVLRPGARRGRLVPVDDVDRHQAGPGAA
jgi:UDP-GlcNAc:undecaprenyl-phosphate GlcNAc-1-phosphate transferase